MFRKVRNGLLIAALAIGIGAGSGMVEQASAHTYVAAVNCGSISPSREILIAYDPYPGAPYHNYYWRGMTASEYWRYCW